MDQDTKNMTRTAIYVAAGGYLLYLAYQLFGRLDQSTGISYTLSLAAMILFAAGGAGAVIFGLWQLISFAKNGASAFEEQKQQDTDIPEEKKEEEQ